jgi:histidinol-phosphatase
MAALDVIVREAGGRFTNLDGVDGIFGGNGLSTNAILHTSVVEALKAKG